MEQQTKRYGISLAVTVLCHVGAALWLGMAGFLFLKPPVSQEPIEIVLNTGGGQAGGGQKALPSPVEETAEMDHPSLSTQEEEPTAEDVTEDSPIMEKQEDPVVEEVFQRATVPDTKASSSASGTEMAASLSGAGSGSGSGEGDATGQGAGEGKAADRGGVMVKALDHRAASLSRLRRLYPMWSRIIPDEPCWMARPGSCRCGSPSMLPAESMRSLYLAVPAVRLWTGLRSRRSIAGLFRLLWIRMASLWLARSICR